MRLSDLETTLTVVRQPARQEPSRACLPGRAEVDEPRFLVTGSPADFKAYCRKIIQTCGKGGGYIMASGCMAENPKLENLRAMMEAIREHSVYK
jgi:uroporphyrinogen-III decarboxylase